MILPRWLPFATAAIVAVLGAAAVAQSAGADDLNPGQVLAALALPGITLLVSRLSGARAAAAALLAVPAVLVLTQYESTSAGWFVLVVIAAQLALSLPFRSGLLVYVVMLLAAGGGAIHQPDDGWISWLIGISAGFWGGWSARARIESLDAERSAALATERQHLARDLHDVVAHTLAVTVLHLGGARLAVQHEPEAAIDAITEAERLARESMAQLRQIVGVLNAGEGDLDDRPQPTAAELPALVDEYCDAGLPLGASISGDLAGLPPTTGVVLYRIAQEALANAARHAPRTPVNLDVDITRDLVHLVIQNPTERRENGASGLGIPSMVDRAAAVGGQLTAGMVEGNWVVEASLPLQPA